MGDRQSVGHVQPAFVLEGETWQLGHLLLNRFQVCAVRRGSMGVIYFCKYFGEGITPCVVKTLPKRLLVDHRELFLREVSTWVELGDHPHIVSAFGAQEVEERPCLFLECIAGDLQHGADLSGWIGSPELDLQRSVTFGHQICEGMAYTAAKFHALGKAFVHRDLKPTNLLVESPEQVKISDFGAALVYDLTQTAELSEDVNLGYRAYVSPEQCRGETKLDVRSDIYSFGCVLYEMLTGKTIFDLPRTSPLLIQAHLDQIPPKPSMFNSRIPAALENLVLKCVEKEREMRPPDFGIVQVELAEIYEQLFGTSPRRLASEGTASERERWRRGVTSLLLGKPEEALEQIGDTPGNRSPSGKTDREVLMREVVKAEALGKMGRLEEALSHIENTLGGDAKEPQLWNQKGRLLTDLGRHEEALKCFNEASELDRHDASVLNNKAYALLALNRPKEALTCLEECLGINKRLAAAWNNRGRAYAALGRWQEASNSYERSIGLNPAEAEVWFNWSVAASNLKETDQVRARLRECLRIDPNHWKGLHNLVVFLLESRGTEEDFLALNETIESQKNFAGWHPKDLNFLAQLVLTLLALSRKPEVLDLLADFLCQESIDKILVENAKAEDVIIAKSYSMLKTKTEAAERGLVYAYSAYLNNNLPAEALVLLSLTWADDILERHPENRQLHLAKKLVKKVRL